MTLKMASMTFIFGVNSTGTHILLVKLPITSLYESSVQLHCFHLYQTESHTTSSIHNILILANLLGMKYGHLNLNCIIALLLTICNIIITYLGSGIVETLDMDNFLIPPKHPSIPILIRNKVITYI